MFQFNTTMVGASFRPADAKDLIRQSSIGDTVALVAEPENPYDSNAVACYIDDVHVGYIPKEDNSVLALHMAGGGNASAEIIAFAGDIKPVLEVTAED